MHGRLGGERRVDHTRLGGAGEIDDPAPPALAHAGQQRVCELAQAQEVERERLHPLLARRVDVDRAAAARCVDEDVHTPEHALRLRGQLLGGSFRVESASIATGSVPPAARISPLSDSSSAVRRAAIATLTPCPASSFAVARPMP